MNAGGAGVGIIVTQSLCSVASLLQGIHLTVVLMHALAAKLPGALLGLPLGWRTDLGGHGEPAGLRDWEKQCRGADGHSGKV